VLRMPSRLLISAFQRSMLATVSHRTRFIMDPHCPGRAGVVAMGAAGGCLRRRLRFVFVARSTSVS
jgi:hypothetical protein